MDKHFEPLVDALIDNAKAIEWLKTCYHLESIIKGSYRDIVRILDYIEAGYYTDRGKAITLYGFAPTTKELIEVKMDVSSLDDFCLSLKNHVDDIKWEYYAIIVHSKEGQAEKLICMTNYSLWQVIPTKGLLKYRVLTMLNDDVQL